MTFGGWIVMAVSVSSVTGLFIWCILRVLRSPEQREHLHGFEMHTPDEK